MRILKNETEFVSQWAPKIGEDAASLRWRASVLLIRCYLLNFFWIPCVIAGAKIPSTPLLILGVLLAITTVFHLVLAGAKLREANKAAGRLLGLRLGFRHVAPPPREAKHYEDWCRRHGVTPYAAQTHAWIRPGHRA
jgi:hypothetical protein